MIKTLNRFLRKPVVPSNVGLCHGFRNAFSGRLDGSFRDDITIVDKCIFRYLLRPPSNAEIRRES